MHILFLSCLKASELIEKNLHYKLSITEKLQLKIHMSMCKACTLYEKQSILLDEGIKRSMQQSNKKYDTADLKAQILKLIQA